MTVTIKRIQEANVTRCENNWHKVVDWSASDWAVAFGGEAGEVLDAVKKLNKIGFGKPMANIPASQSEAIEHIGDELADTIHYATLLAARLDIDLEYHLRKTFNNVSRRNSIEELL